MHLNSEIHKMLIASFDLIKPLLFMLLFSQKRI